MTASARDSTQQWLDLAASGRNADIRRATSGLFVEHRDEVLTLCRRLTRHEADAEDALQETFLGVLRGLTSFRGDSHFRTWLYRIAVRSALRVKARSRRSVPGEAARRQAAVPANHPLESAEQVQRIRDTIDKLPLEQQLVLKLSTDQALEAGMIGEILGIAEGTVWSRLHRARQTLQRLLRASP